MSLLWPDRVGVALFPDRLVTARVGGGWRERLIHKEVLPLEPADGNVPLWRAALDALAAQAAAGALSRAQVTVVLSSFFVRYTLVPWMDALGSEEEETAFVRHCFASVYGDQAEGWTVKLSSSAPGKARLACAVDAALIEALNGVMAPYGRAYRSLQPHLMASFNRWHARLGERPLWFVVAEPGLLCVALLRDGQWQSVRTINVGGDWLKELPRLLGREECVVDSPSDCNDVALFAPDAPERMTVDAGKWRVSNLLPTLVRGMAAGVDAPFSIAAGV